MAQPRLAYLISRYPAVSHTFILREVLRLRESGFEIHTASINPPDRAAEKMPADERAEAAATYCVKQTPLTTVLAELLACLLSTPGGMLRGLVRALHLGGADLRALLYHLAYFVEAVLVGRWMRSRRVGHLHVHFATPAATVGLLTSRIFGASLSLTVHGPDEFYNVAGYRLAEKIEAASFVCCIGRYCRSQLMKLSAPDLWDRFEISPLGVDPAEYAPRPEPSTANGFELLCVGRLVPAKGQMVLLHALKALAETGYPVRVHFAGDGPDRPALEGFVARHGLKAHVLFHGSLNPDDVRALLRRAHAFVLPSFAEGIPVALMEAMAMEIPCVSTVITGIPELIDSGRDGLLVPASDAEALATAIVRLMEDAGLRGALAAAGRRKILDRYNLPANVEHLAGIFARRLAEAA